MSDAAVRRAAKFGDEYHPLWITPQELEERIRKLRKESSNIPVALRLRVEIHRNRSLGARSQSPSSLDQISKQIENFSKAGVDRLLVEFDLDKDASSWNEDVKSFANGIIKSFP